MPVQARVLVNPQRHEDARSRERRAGCIPGCCSARAHGSGSTRSSSIMSSSQTDVRAVRCACAHCTQQNAPPNRSHPDLPFRRVSPLRPCTAVVVLPWWSPPLIQPRETGEQGVPLRERWDRAQRAVTDLEACGLISSIAAPARSVPKPRTSPDKRELLDAVASCLRLDEIKTLLSRGAPCLRPRVCLFRLQQTYLLLLCLLFRCLYACACVSDHSSLPLPSRLLPSSSPPAQSRQTLRHRTHKT
jgi:hypothetical protein